MYHTNAFWGLESNPNAYALNNTMNVATSYSIYPIVAIIVIVAIAMILVGLTTRGFG